MNGKQIFNQSSSKLSDSKNGEERIRDANQISFSSFSMNVNQRPNRFNMPHQESTIGAMQKMSSQIRSVV